MSLTHLSNNVLVSTVFLLVSPLSTVTTVALRLRAALVLTFVLSRAFGLALLSFAVFAFLAFVTVHSADFRRCLSQ